MSATAQKLAQLNAFRANEGLAPYAAWKNARHQPMLDAYTASPRKRAALASGHIAAPVNPDAMRPINEELGNDIKATRAAWRASGANVTKKEFAMDLMLNGVTIKGLVDKMGITATAARSLIGDVRRVPGAIVTREKDVYFLELPTEDESDEEDGE